MNFGGSRAARRHTDSMIISYTYFLPSLKEKYVTGEEETQ